MFFLPSSLPNMFLSSFSLLSLAILGHASSQSVFGLKHPAANPYTQSAYAAPYGDGLFTPLGDLSALSTDSFTTLRHPLFASYSVRIKQTVFDCDKQSTSVHLCMPFSRLTCCLVHTQVTSTIKGDISSSTSLRAATTLPRMMSFSGQMEVCRSHWCERSCCITIRTQAPAALPVWVCSWRMAHA